MACAAQFRASCGGRAPTAWRLAACLLFAMTWSACGTTKQSARRSTTAAQPTTAPQTQPRPETATEPQWMDEFRQSGGAGTDGQAPPPATPRPGAAPPRSSNQPGVAPPRPQAGRRAPETNGLVEPTFPMDPRARARLRLPAYRPDPLDTPRKRILPPALSRQLTAPEPKRAHEPLPAVRPTPAVPPLPTESTVSDPGVRRTGRTADGTAPGQTSDESSVALKMAAAALLPLALGVLLLLWKRQREKASS